jgi:hypothetical protein
LAKPEASAPLLFCKAEVFSPHSKGGHLPFFAAFALFKGLSSFDFFSLYLWGEGTSKLQHQPTDRPLSAKQLSS